MENEVLRIQPWGFVESDGKGYLLTFSVEDMAYKVVCEGKNPVRRGDIVMLETGYDDRTFVRVKSFSGFPEITMTLPKREVVRIVDNGFLYHYGSKHFFLQHNGNINTLGEMIYDVPNLECFWDGKTFYFIDSGKEECIMDDCIRGYCQMNYIEAEKYDIKTIGWLKKKKVIELTKANGKKMIIS